MLNNKENVKNHKIEDACCSIANKAGQKLRENLDTVENEINDASASVVKQIRRKPIESGLIAVGVGFILGLLSRR